MDYQKFPPIGNPVKAAENRLTRVQANWMTRADRVQSYARSAKLCLNLHLSEIQILNVERVFLDELTAGLYHIAHQFCKQIISLDHIIHAHLQQRARIWI